MPCIDDLLDQVMGQNTLTKLISNQSTIKSTSWMRMWKRWQ